MIRLITIVALFILLGCSNESNQLTVEGLQSEVEVLRDTYGVNHIYAQNEHDLFFAQGYCAARDRLFQFELWRRQATGTIAEILGEREVKRDVGIRLFKFRGNLEEEFNHYHAHGSAIIHAYTDGVNAYITQALKDTASLPLEFKLLSITPQLWKPEVVISRHQGLLGNLTEELNFVRAVVAIGEEKVKLLSRFEPGEPDLSLDPILQKEKMFDNVIELYDAFRKPVAFKPDDLNQAVRQNVDEFRQLASADDKAWDDFVSHERKSIGSNNWIVGKEKSKSGSPMLANDPHRTLTVPSLRYMVHLSAPGWNVLGGGEPTIPGVSIGHNEYGAWGLTIFSIDAEDLYVYELNPSNLSQYRYKGTWEDMNVIADTIQVKNSPDVYANHLYTRHGPVTFVDSVNHIAYAVRCGWLEAGGSPYLASLRMDQSKNWEEFREACSFSRIPGENMIWADKKGTIGWQAVGVAPIRKNWSGLVPVPGDGRFEWDGYLPIQSLPSITNPAEGFFATANENNVPLDYPSRNAVGWTWAEKYRVNRIKEVLNSTDQLTLDDMMKLQCDYLSLPAREIVPLLKDLKSTDEVVEKVRSMLLNWDCVLDKNSVEAGVYMAWEKRLTSGVWKMMVPEAGKKYIKSIPVSKVISFITSMRKELGGKEGCNKLLLTSLMDAIDDLSKKLGPDMNQWQYGQPSYHHALIKHPLSNAVNDSIRKKFDAGPIARGGNGSTPGMTTNSDNQISGASFRMVVGTQDWDSTLFTNAPGQSGDPDSKFYKNLFDLWASDKYFRVYFTRKKVEESSVEKTILKH